MACTVWVNVWSSVEILRLYKDKQVISQTDQKMAVLADMVHLVKQFTNVYVSDNVHLYKQKHVNS